MENRCSYSHCRPRAWATWFGKCCSLGTCATCSWASKSFAGSACTKMCSARIFYCAQRIARRKKIGIFSRVVCSTAAATRSCRRTVHFRSNRPRKRCALHASTTMCTARCIAKVVQHYERRPLRCSICTLCFIWSCFRYLYGPCQYGCHCATHSHCTGIK